MNVHVVVIRKAVVRRLWFVWIHSQTLPHRPGGRSHPNGFWLTTHSLRPLSWPSGSLTLQREDGVPVNHDAQLQDELRGGLQEGLQEAEHGDVSALKHQTPVEVAPGAAAVPAALSPQVEGVEVPEERRHQGGLGGTSQGSVELNTKHGTNILHLLSEGSSAPEAEP